jgi:hypothetical protein
VGVEDIERIVHHLQVRQILVVEHHIDRITAAFESQLEVPEAIVGPCE